TWLLRKKEERLAASEGERVPAERSPALAAKRSSAFERFRAAYARVVARLLKARFALVPLYLIAACAIVWVIGTRLGTEIFPPVDTGQFQIRFRAPEGTRFETTE